MMRERCLEGGAGELTSACRCVFCCLWLEKWRLQQRYRRQQNIKNVLSEIERKTSPEY